MTVLENEENSPASKLEKLETLETNAGWGKAPRETLNKAKRYSRFVRVMKYALPIMLGALAMIVVIYAFFPADVKQVSMAFARLGWGDLTMTSPRLTGVDGEGQPYTVTALRAVQDRADPHKAQLVKVEADVTMKDGTWINVTSDAGALDSEQHKLDLSGNIAIFADNGYEAHTPTAAVDLKSGLIHGAGHVDAQGPLGTLSADKFEVHRDTKKLYFSGNVHTVFYHAGEKH